ncbi:MAG: hypothetical protein HRU28_03025, partial [Rhizobiales bacterium]|nr:hypothetical protein [Hyphomicrobiales bacterium]
MTKINRRAFVKSAFASLAIAATPKFALAQVDENTFHLTASKTQHNLIDGYKKSELWLFNKQISGPEIRVKQVVGNTEMFDGLAWSYPKWKGYPFIPFFA